MPRPSVRPHARSFFPSPTRSTRSRRNYRRSPRISKLWSSDLTVLEQKLIAIARSGQSEEQALEARQNLEKHLRPWRSKMTAPQIAMLETQFLDRATLESAGLPRLSLFYLR